MIPSIIVAVILAVLIFFAIIKIIKDKKSGKHSCNYGGSCSCCPMAGKCHIKK